MKLYQKLDVAYFNSSRMIYNLDPVSSSFDTVLIWKVLICLANHVCAETIGEQQSPTITFIESATNLSSFRVILEAIKNK
jgi:hypothetical protein